MLQVTTAMRPRRQARESFWATIRADLRGFLELDRERPHNVGRYLDVLTQPGFLCVFIYRISLASRRAGLVPISRLLYLVNMTLFGADLSPRAQVGPGLVIPHPVGVGIVAHASIGRNVHLFMGVTVAVAGRLEPGRDGFPTLCDGCMIMDDAKVFGPVVVGEAAVVGANSVVMHDVPPGAIVIGSPARILRYREGYGPPNPESPAGRSH